MKGLPMRVVCALFLLICISIVAVGCGTSNSPPPNKAVDVSSPEALKKALPPPPGMPGGTTAPKK
jgi:hypothetical protein